MIDQQVTTVLLSEMLLDWSPCQSIAGFACILYSVSVWFNRSTTPQSDRPCSARQYKAGTNQIDLRVVRLDVISPQLRNWSPTTTFLTEMYDGRISTSNTPSNFGWRETFRFSCLKGILMDDVAVIDHTTCGELIILRYNTVRSLSCGVLTPMPLAVLIWLWLVP